MLKVYLAPELNDRFLENLTHISFILWFKNSLVGECTYELDNIGRLRASERERRRKRERERERETPKMET